MNIRFFAITAAILASLSSPALAKEKHAHPHVSKNASLKKCGGPELAYDAIMAKMHKAMDISYTGNSDIDYVAGMIPHHQGAVDMAKIELLHGKDPTMRWLAEWIIQAQITEIGTMQGWLRGRLNAAAPKAQTPEIAQYQAVMDKMHHAMMIPYTGNADIDFARGMIPHHQGAIDMSEILLRRGQNQEIKKLAADIINSQSQEIGIMKRWLARQPLNSAPPAPPIPKSKAKSHH